MILEYIRYRIPAARRREFEAAWSQARVALDDSPNCLGYDVAHGVEEAESYIVRIKWDSVHGHEEGFRRSAGFGPFLAAVKPFFEQIEEMRHYEPTAIGG